MALYDSNPEEPTITCPENIDTVTEPGKPTAIVNWTRPSAADNSGNVTVTSYYRSGMDFNIGLTVVTLNATDPSGNMDSCQFNVTVNDTEDPGLNCPKDFTQETDIAEPFADVYWPNLNATDNSGSVNVTCSPEEGSEFIIGSTNVYCNATDPSSNWNTCNFTITVIDKEQPNMTCPDDIEKKTLVGKPFTFVTWSFPNATDNSGNVTVTCSHESGTKFTIGSSNISFNASDPYGNWYSCHFIVTVIDVERPIIICPDNINITTNPGQPTAVVNWTQPNATDNSGNVTVSGSHQPGSEFVINITIVNYTASDPSGNEESCYFNVTVFDIEDPHILCPDNIKLNTDPGKPTAIVNWTHPYATDNSQYVFVTSNHQPGTEFDIGSTVVNYNVSDYSGNMDSCHFNVTVVDKERPNMTCPDNIEENTLIGKPFAVVNWSLPNATDNTGNVTVTCSHESGTKFTIGSTNVSFNASDPYGNWFSCYFQVIIIDWERPSIFCPDNINITTNPGQPTAVVNWTEPNATDNSGNVTVSSNRQSGSKFVINMTVVNYTARDPSGNEDSCHFNVTVIEEALITTSVTQNRTDENPVLVRPDFFLHTCGDKPMCQYRCQVVMTITKW
ncbi:hyalin-like [Ptychodera flava]|uniref:hyalin-like n=1 Tax=Ptychodera flava TaxID=63121 RepID=UPI00396A3A89